MLHETRNEYRYRETMDAAGDDPRERLLAVFDERPMTGEKRWGDLLRLLAARSMAWLRRNFRTTLLMR